MSYPSEETQIRKANTYSTTLGCLSLLYLAVFSVTFFFLSWQLALAFLLGIIAGVSVNEANNRRGHVQSSA